MSLLSWAAPNEVNIEVTLAEHIRTGFPVGKDDAFDAVVGLFGIVQACLGLRSVKEPQGDALAVEGWILGRETK